MDFVYDADKSASNSAKHGIDFKTSQALWADPDFLVVPATTSDEPRYLSIGLITGRHLTAIWTPRDDKVRIISVRRSRKEEITYYES